MALYVVATPIGNMEDITLRGVSTLKRVQAVIAEDTRSYRKLAVRLDIPAKPVFSLYKGNESARVDHLIPKLKEGLEAALVSESGTPAVSDPGALLVRRCHESGIRVIPVPGASAVAAILSVAGHFCDRVTFFGFLSKRNRIDDAARELSQGAAVIFFDHPARIFRSLEAFADRGIPLRAVMGRELTKLHEEIVSGTLPDLIAALRGRALKGEIVVLLEPVRGPVSLPEELERQSQGEDLLRQFHKDNLSLSDSVKVAARQTSLPRRRLYAQALKIWNRA